MKDTEINDILTKGASSLDITPSMFKEATDHYNAVGQYLENQGIEVDTLPFGSIMTGTVVRPYSKDEDAYFDIDVLVNRRNLDRTNSTPGIARNPIDEALLGSERYGDMVEECGECITVKYVSDGVEGGFRLDLNTCVYDSVNPCAQVCETYPKYAGDAVAIAWKNPEQWHGSNPRGLCRWFIDKNERFAAAGKAQRKARILRESRGVFASIEEIPDALDRSMMQRAVQVLKRSRDVYYHRSVGLNKAPASCIITVMIGNLSEELSDDANVVEFLEGFARSARSVATTRVLRNPVYNENLLHDWKDESFANFASWIEEIRRSLDSLRCGTQSKRGAAAEAIFGRKIGNSILPAAMAGTSVPAIVKPSRPWAI